MEFIILPPKDKTPTTRENTAFLTADNWNDYSFVTMFYLSLNDEKGIHHELGCVKIGFKGQTTKTSTCSSLDRRFSKLLDGYFSVGQDVDYYKKASALSVQSRKILLEGLKDIAFLPELIQVAQNEDVFRTSLLRSVSLSVVRGQYCRVLSGMPPLTNYKFKYTRQSSASMSEIELQFEVRLESKPSTNIHAIIGRNGVGKTTVLNGMIEAALGKGESGSKFYNVEEIWEQPIDKDYFSSLVSVSFSAFDTFSPPKEQLDPSVGTCYFCIGLKKSDNTLKEISDIRLDFLGSLKVCLSQASKRARWLKAIKTLESDENFERMELTDLANSGEAMIEKAAKLIERMSSGHAVVLLTITRLVETIEEKTLVIIDEPESHLHPPLLSAFLRALSELLHDRNGVSIIATHSPVVLQEVPRSCVWKINRVGKLSKPGRPDIETFGENVGILTREVFKLEVVKSGFHDLLVKSVETGATYQEIVTEYDAQLGMEARAILKTLVTYRDRSKYS